MDEDPDSGQPLFFFRITGLLAPCDEGREVGPAARPPDALFPHWAGGTEQHRPVLLALGRVWQRPILGPALAEWAFSVAAWNSTVFLWRRCGRLFQLSPFYPRDF